MDSTTVRRQWAKRSGEYSPAYYAYYGPNETSALLCDIFDRHLDTDAQILELGCSSGRHLSYLFDHGYESLTGIDLNEAAFDVLGDTFPELDDAGTFYQGAIEDVLVEFDDNQFDAVYSVETLQHVHPESTTICKEIARITKRLLVTVENEGDVEDEPDSDRHDGLESPPKNGLRDYTAVSYINDEFPLYHRNWGQIFSDVGMTEIDVEPIGNTVLRTFRSAVG